jgi:DNA (cytosine-5)-methyltransferase 1
MARSLRKHTTKDEGSQPLRVVELFAGVGGFRLGLCGKNDNSKDFKTVWFNQWEPGTKKQHAHDVYKARFEEGVDEETRLTNVDIAAVVRMAQTGQFKIPDHDVLVGGFPCQDYSVARTLSQAKGIAGKKGVLWWEIRNILELKQKENKPVKYLFLENVDRLLKSPASQRGRDFAIILATLADLGYSVEWRVINAADYGMPQRRRRIFITAYHSSTSIYKAMKDAESHAWLLRKGVFASAFPVESTARLSFSGNLIGGYPDITEKFNLDAPDASPFYSAGMMRDRVFHSMPVTPSYKGKAIKLKDILVDEKDIPEQFFIEKDDMKRWEYLKGAKKEERKGKNGFKFTYNEGPMIFPDPIDKPSRTIITGEGGPTPSRFKHVVKTKKGYRRLTPLELERLCMFPDNHTALKDVSDVRRAFFMGNALVVGAIDRIGKALVKSHKNSGKDGSNSSNRSILSPLSPKAATPNRHRSPTKTP